MKCRSNRHFCSFSQYRELAAIKINPRQNFLTQKKVSPKKPTTSVSWADILISKARWRKESKFLFCQKYFKSFKTQKCIYDVIWWLESSKNWSTIAKSSVNAFLENIITYFKILRSSKPFGFLICLKFLYNIEF